MDIVILITIILGFTGLNVLMAFFLGRKNVKWVFIPPALLAAFSLYFIFLTVRSESSWVALGNFIFAFAGSISTLLTFITVGIIYLKKRKEKPLAK